jgi:hypothetical protein
VRRRSFLVGVPTLGLAAAPSVRRELFLASPQKGTAVMAYGFYTESSGGRMMSIEQRISRSDTIDVAYIRRLQDFGAKWSAPVEMRTAERRPEGMLRRHPRCGFPVGGRYIEFWNEGILPTDNPLEGLRQWNIYFRVSADGGRTFGPARQIIHAGDSFGPRHPLPGVWTGKNCVMLGDVACVPIMNGGRILLPVQITPLAPDGALYNPGGGYTYTDVAVLHGHWQNERIEWIMSDVIHGDPARSTRGMDEATIGELEGHRLLLVMRGSNDRRPELPGYRWVSVSSDGGLKWTTPRPWTYNDGKTFFSPSSCSQLVRHSSGRLFWLGNITPENPRGNRPRYPFVIGEVDRNSGLLRRRAVRVLDTRQPGEDANLTLSNFFAREDRSSGGIAVHMTRLFARDGDWAGDAYLYRVRV